ncbi:MAG: ankyrin repeat domain-containing protein [Wolbachia endosymbiont of Xenopsylla cheopis]
MNKLSKNVKNNLNLVWLIVTVICVLITYYCIKVRATNNYKEILQVAAENCNSEIVKFLVKDIVNINNNPSFGSIALLYAARGECLEIIKFLIEEGVDINATNGSTYKRTALHHAAYKGHLAGVKFLLEKGANPNIRGNDGRNPRDMAVIVSQRKKNRTYEEIISLLYNAEKEHE